MKMLATKTFYFNDSILKNSSVDNWVSTEVWDNPTLGLRI